ncbi:hypothetical protein GALL_357070 [mine drainage metagenome]|uniref:Uncharacterized protein n=1 Tax=mine drainage metagenome TaxID=410659 RepID=A0A1J5R2W7_9ZZZZ
MGSAENRQKGDRDDVGTAHDRLGEVTGAEHLARGGASPLGGELTQEQPVLGDVVVRREVLERAEPLGGGAGRRPGADVREGRAPAITQVLDALSDAVRVVAAHEVGPGRLGDAVELHHRDLLGGRAQGGDGLLGRDRDDDEPVHHAVHEQVDPGGLGLDRVARVAQDQRAMGVRERLLDGLDGDHEVRVADRRHDHPDRVRALGAQCPREDVRAVAEVGARLEYASYHLRVHGRVTRHRA